jgi:hypothetical protein
MMPLNYLKNTINDELILSIRRLVRQKYEYDKFTLEDGGSFFNQGLEIYMGPMEPYEFFQAIFPFTSECSFVECDRYSAIVPASQTVGCSWKWRRRDLSAEKQTNYVEFFTNADRACQSKNSLNCADYHYIRPLGLFLPTEGKNRVDFLREINVEGIPARITEMNYPDPSRIKIYNFHLYERCEHWAVLDDRYVARLDYPAWSTPVMIEYGVVVSNKWPTSFPDEAKVAAFFGQKKGGLDKTIDKCVDLMRIDDFVARRNEFIPCSISELDFLRISNLNHIKLWKYVSLLLLLIIAFTSNLPPMPHYFSALWLVLYLELAFCTFIQYFQRRDYFEKLSCIQHFLKMNFFNGFNS